MEPSKVKLKSLNSNSTLSTPSSLSAIVSIPLVKSEQSHPLGDGKNRSLEAKNDRKGLKNGVYPFNSCKTS